MSELQSLVSDATKSGTDRGLYNTEFQKLATAVKDVVDSTDFNGNDVFGTFDVKVNDDTSGTGKTIAAMSSSLTGLAGYASSPLIAAGTIDRVRLTTYSDAHAATASTYIDTTNIYGTATAAASVTDLAGAPVNGSANAAGSPYTTTTTTSFSAADIKADIQTIASLRATNGANQSMLGYYSEINTSAKATFESAISKIVDVDVAAESTQLARWNTLVQAGTAMIAQANSSTQSALTLLRG
jgi:flagellin